MPHLDKALQSGATVWINTPENPRLHNRPGRVVKLEEWGALLETDAAATGYFRALFEEMNTVPPAASRAAVSSVARQKGYTGDICDLCGGCKVRRNGVCLVCEDCGTTSGCS